ncbi:MAG: CBS domain-containing protein [Acidimicrobiia bacterium]
MHVQAILSRKGAAVATVEAGASVARAVELLREHGVGALVVSDDGSIIEGIISERDVVRRLAEEGAAVLDATVARVMTRSVTTCRPDDDLDHLGQLMTDQRIRHVPVVDDHGAMTGIISIGDVVKQRLGHLENENQALFDYITNAR